MTRRLAVLLLLLLSSTALAIDFAGEDVLVPIVGRTAGANGTFWSTDLTISNLSTVNETTTAATPRAPGWIVLFDDGVNSQIATGGLAAKYGFTPEFVYTVISAFSAELPKEIVAKLQCEAVVQRIEGNASGGGG